jgi:hypothetical protein
LACRQPLVLQPLAPRHLPLQALALQLHTPRVLPLQLQLVALALHHPVALQPLALQLVLPLQLQLVALALPWNLKMTTSSKKIR